MQANERMSFDIILFYFFVFTKRYTRTRWLHWNADEFSMGNNMPTNITESKFVLCLFLLRSLKTFERHWCLFLRIKPYIYYNVGMSLCLSRTQRLTTLIFSVYNMLLDWACIWAFAAGRLAESNWDVMCEWVSFVVNAWITTRTGMAMATAAAATVRKSANANVRVGYRTKERGKIAKEEELEWEWVRAKIQTKRP